MDKVGFMLITPNRCNGINCRFFNKLILNKLLKLSKNDFLRIFKNFEFAVKF